MFCGFYIRQAKKKQAISKAGITLSRISFTIRGDIRSTKLILRKKKYNRAIPQRGKLTFHSMRLNFTLPNQFCIEQKL